MSNVSYISTNVENGITFDDLVGNLLAFKPANWGYTEQDYNRIAIEFGVTSNSLYYLPEGNYKIENIPDFPVAASFVNAAVFLQNDGSKLIICNYGGREKYSTILTSASSPVVWTDLTNTDNDGRDILLIDIGDTPPENTGLMWVDTSDFESEQSVYLKYYTAGKWVSYTSEGIMMSDIYDQQGKCEDPYLAIAEKISEFISGYNNFVHHKNNEFTLMHITQAEREHHNTYLLSRATVASYFSINSELYNSLVEVIRATSANATQYARNEMTIQSASSDLTYHLSTHLTEDKIASWDAKADPDHRHDQDPDVYISADHIGGTGTISLSQLPNEIKERITTVATVDAMHALTTAQINDGDYVYVEDDTWLYRVVNAAVLGTTNKANAFKKVIGNTQDYTFDSINNTPKTLAGYGITDALSKSEYNDIVDSYMAELTFEYTPVGFDLDALRSAGGGSLPRLYFGIQKSLSAKGGGTPNYPMSTTSSDLDILLAADTTGDMFSDLVYKFNSKITDHWWDRATISDTPREWSEIRYGNGVYVAITLDSSIIAYSSDCINWHEVTISDTPREWWSLCYGGNKFVVIAKYSNVVACSSDGQTWTEYTVSDVERAWWAICYGGGKFVMCESGSNIFAYSTDGMNWTEVEVGDIDRYWYSICHGDGKFVAIAAGDIATAYSTDGINWTETDIIDIAQDWHVVCYGNGKYVAIACDTDTFAYSDDGITWHETKVSNMPRRWYHACFGGGYFVAIEYGTNVFVYSTDGINWTEAESNKLSLYWYSICYGNGKFVTIASDSNVVAFTDTLGDSLRIEAGLSEHVTQFWPAYYFETEYRSDSSNPSWESDGLGRMFRIDTSSDNTLIDETYTINGVEYAVNVVWDISRGIVFKIPMGKATKSLQFIHDNFVDKKATVVKTINEIAAALNSSGANVTMTWSN